MLTLWRIQAFMNANSIQRQIILKLDDPRVIQGSTGDEKRASPRHLVDRNGESISDAQRRTRNTKPSFFESQVYGSCYKSEVKFRLQRMAIFF